MADLDAPSRAAEQLLARKEEIANATTSLLYARTPSLTQKYGDHGRARCLQDMRYTVEHLAPAVAMADPGLFAQYARWLVQLLAPRNVPLDDVRASLSAMRAVLADMDASLASQVDDCIRAGLAVLDDPSQS
jgi:hypothetical protein